MTANNAQCHDRQTVGHLLWHEARFTGPAAGSPCELPEGLRGQVEHIFENRSIYPQVFSTTAWTMPSALTIGPSSPPPVRVPAARTGPLRRTPSTASASQKVEHVPGTGLGLPHTGTAAFTTTVTAPWGAGAPSAAEPAVSITLTP